MTKASENVFPKIIVSEEAAPATPAAGTVVVYAKTDGLLYSKDDAGVETLVSGGAGGGGGLTHAYVGTNSVGGTWETMTNRRWHLKPFTLAAAGVLINIAAHLRSNTDDTGAMAGAVFADAAGQPDDIIGYFPANDRSDLIMSHAAATAGSGRWFHIPAGIYLPAGDYWLAVASIVPVTARIDIAKVAGGGSDKYFTAGGDWAIDGNYHARTTSSDTYSIRGSVLT